MPGSALHAFTTGELVILLGVAFLVGAAAATTACALAGLRWWPGRKELARG